MIGQRFFVGPIRDLFSQKQNKYSCIKIRNFVKFANHWMTYFLKGQLKLFILIVSFRENADSEDQPAQPPESSEQPSTEGSPANPQSDLTQEPGHPEESSNPSLSTDASTSGRNAIGRTINEIQDSITTMREEYIDR